jgi:tRNA pseudouridine55 synthase
VARCRRLYGQRRVGHAGTLDPGATGVLLVGLGRATRLLQFLTGLPKSYTAEVVLGVATSTLDDEGTETGRWDMSAVAPEDVRRAAAGLTGPIMQVPPMVSAVKIDGQRLHRLARQGVEVERPARPVTVHRYDVEPTPDPSVYAIAVECSSGTYVRSLAADLGAALGGGAHLRHLRRTAVGAFAVADAVTLDVVEADPLAVVRPPRAALAALPTVTVADDVAVQVSHGRPLPLGVDGPAAVVDGGGALLAVYDRREGRDPSVLFPVVVL